MHERTSLASNDTGPVLPLRDGVVPVFDAASFVEKFIDIVGYVTRGEDTCLVRFQKFVDDDAVVHGKTGFCKWLRDGSGAYSGDDHVA